MSKLDIASLPVKTGSIYPAKYADQMQGRSSVRLGDAGGLTQFGVNLVRLEPGAMSSLRHWHLREDEFVMVTSGTCTLINDDGETDLKTGECAAFPAGQENGHHFVNKTDDLAEFLVIGTKHPNEVATYSDIDMMVSISDGTANFTKKDGSPV